jgi:low affinity Fe/Cu permease
MLDIKNPFRKFAVKVANLVGSAYTFIFALIIILAWALTGPVFHFSNTWQLVINTGTTIITFLMVFIIQNTQNRDSKSVQLKLDELLRTNKGARDSMVDVEELTDEELEKLQDQFRQLHQHYAKELERRSKK